eukprot:gene9002-10625_t
MDKDTSVKVAVRIRPLSTEEAIHEPILCLDTIPEGSQIVAGNDTFFTFDYVFGVETQQSKIYDECVIDLVDAFFEGFNATILAYGQTGSGKTWTMGSSSDTNMTLQTIGIIPRVIKNLFEQVKRREASDPDSTYKIQVQFLEIYGEDIRDLLDQTKTSNVTIRETREDGVFVAGAREELVSSYEQMMKALEDGTKHRTTASTRMNQTSSRSHAIFTVILEHTIYDGSVVESGLDGGVPEVNISTELLEMRTKKEYVEVENPVPLELLENWALASVKNPYQTAANQPSRAGSASSLSLSMKCAALNGEMPVSPVAASHYSSPVGNFSAASSFRDNGFGGAPLSPVLNNNNSKNDRNSKEVASLRSRVRDADYEVQRLTSQLKTLRVQMSESEESLILASSERDFYKMKWADSSPSDAQKLDGAGSPGGDGSGSPQQTDRAEAAEKKKVMDILGNHLREIDSLKKALAEEKSRNSTAMAAINFDLQESGAGSMDSDFTTSISTLLNQTREQLRLESLRLKGIDRNTSKFDEEANSDEERPNAGDNAKSLEEMEDEQKAYLKRQKLLTTEKEARERGLREELKRKDEELRSLKKKQDELNRLSQMQTRYSSQLTKLETDITSMKKQRVDLTKTLNNEKKNHLAALSDKVREIDKLKRELAKSTNEVKKLGRERELAESKAKDAMREGVVLKKKTQELMKDRVNVNHNLSSARTAYRAVNKMSRISSNLSGAKRILSEEELRVKRWIDKRIEEISEREVAAEALKAQYEHQLELLNRKETLEQERSLALEKKSEAGSDKSAGSDLASSSGLLLSAGERDVLLEIEDQLTSIDGELDERHLQISTIAQQIANSGDVAGSEKTMEVLKRTAAGSLPAAHELIRLLFDMLVHSSRSIQLRWEEVQEYREREKDFKQEIEELMDQLASDKRAHDLELTRSANEYEEKLQDLFEQIAVSNYKLFEKDGNGAAAGDAEVADPVEKEEQAKMEPVRLQLAVSTEECKFLRSQLGREGARYTQIQTKCNDLEKQKLRLIRENQDKADQIKFLEEDRSLFKTLADDLKSGLNSLGKPGKTILDTVKDRHHSFRAKRGLFAEYTSLSDNEDDDSESVLGEFEFLADEIARTGGISAPSEKSSASVSSTNNNNGSASTSAATTPSRSIYDRLTNPSNFTGYMKNVFENDLELKRKKIQQIKEKHSNPNLNLTRRDSGVYRSIDAPLSSRRNPETQKFFSEYYDRDRNNAATPTSSAPAVTAETPAAASGTASTAVSGDIASAAAPSENGENLPAAVSADGSTRQRSNSLPRNDQTPRSSSAERREPSPSMKRYSSSAAFPPRPPGSEKAGTAGSSSTEKAPVEWSISADPWR